MSNETIQDRDGWWKRRSIARLQERISDLEAQYEIWMTACDQTSSKGATVSGAVINRIAHLRGEIAKLKTRLQNRMGQTT